MGEGKEFNSKTEIGQLVSIIIPCYNREDLLGQTLDSVLYQEYPNWECYIVDDGSTDGSKKVAKNFCTKDNRFNLLDNTRSKGAQGARNTGILSSRGDFLVFLDSDDLLSTNCLARRIKETKTNPKFEFYVFLTGVFNKNPFDTEYVWNHLNKDVDDLERFFRQDMPWQTTSVLWTKSAINKVGLFDERLPCWQDWEYHVRAIVKNLKYFKSADNVENIDSFYRIDPSISRIGKMHKTKAHCLGSAMAIEIALNHINKEQPKKIESVTFEAIRLAFRNGKRLSNIKESGFDFFLKVLSLLRVNKYLEKKLAIYYRLRICLKLPRRLCKPFLWIFLHQFLQLEDKKSSYLKAKVST